MKTINNGFVSEKTMPTHGVLYVVATPIGNLDDITFRAIETLKAVDLIACEDTRVSRVLLDTWNVSTSMLSLHRFNETRKTSVILDHLRKGSNVALISDAGTPNISDPGYRLVRSAMDEGFRVVPIPGPSSVVAALSVSGIDGSSFVFMGFSPKKKSALEQFFQTVSHEGRTAIFLDTARRIMKTLEIAVRIIPSRRMTLARELTKKFEEIISGEPASIFERFNQRQNIKGEFVVIVEPAKVQLDLDVDSIVRGLIREGYSGKALADEARTRFGVSKSVAYSRFLSLKESSSSL
ncbi:MAG: 16S rRNA (cytidine(1402)-2'-O)-methyltransferase [Desulfomonilaceae bacterium]